jgi:hypothetical protein
LKKKTDSGYGKVFIAGVIFAVIIAIVIWFLPDDKVVKPKSWSPEVEEQFLKSCYGNYQSQITTDEQREATFNYCKCMLEKMKANYDQSQMDAIPPEVLKLWDTQCRNEVSTTPSIRE